MERRITNKMMRIVIAFALTISLLIPANGMFVYASQENLAPGTPSLTHDNWDKRTDFNIEMNMWWGYSGTSWKLYEKAPGSTSYTLYTTKDLTANSGQGAQNATLAISKKDAASGDYSYYAELINLYGTSKSNTITISIMSTSTSTTQSAIIAPSKPSISHDNWDRDGNFNIKMNLWYGQNGTSCEFYEKAPGSSTYTKIDTITPSNGDDGNSQLATKTLTGKTAGTYSYYCKLINSIGGTDSDVITVMVNDSTAPTTDTEAAEKAVVVDTVVTQKAGVKPGTPFVAHDNWDKDGTYKVWFDMWYGENGTSFKIYERQGTSGSYTVLTSGGITTGGITCNTPNKQHVSVSLTGKTAGTYSYYAELTNSVGTASSDPVLVTVNSNSTETVVVGTTTTQTTPEETEKKQQETEKVTVTDTEAPITPSGLTCTSKSHNSITVKWNASWDASGIDRYIPNLNGTDLSSVTGTTYTFTGLDAQKAYTIKVKAVEKTTAALQSAYSKELSVTTENTPAVTIVAQKTTTSAASISGKKNIVYFEGWAVYGRAVTAKEIDPNYVTGVNFAFADLGSDGSMKVGDPWSDVQKPFLGESWEIAAEAKGTYAVLRNLKENNPHLEILLSVGGWTWSSNFHDVAADDAKLNNFKESIKKFVLTPEQGGAVYGGFDGIDIDWEFPVEGGNNIKQSTDDIYLYTKFLKAAREALDEASTKAGGKHFILTIAGSPNPKFATHNTILADSISSDPNLTEKLSKLSQAGKDFYTKYPYGALHYLDWINIMTYDYNGGWDTITNQNAPLYPSTLGNAAKTGSGSLSVSDTVKKYKASGVPYNKIVMGLGAYGRGLSQVEAGSTYGAGQAGKGLAETASGMNVGSWAGSTWDFYDLVDRYINKNGYTRYWDETSKNPYLYNPTTKIWIGYDDGESILYKSSFAKELDLLGTMWWAFSADKYKLLQKIPVGVMNGTISPVDITQTVAFNKAADTANKGINSDIIKAATLSDASTSVVENKVADSQAVVTKTDPDQPTTTTSSGTTTVGYVSNAAITASNAVNTFKAALSKTDFEALFPYRNGGDMYDQFNGIVDKDSTPDFYSYENFLQAVEGISNIVVKVEYITAAPFYQRIVRYSKGADGALENAYVVMETPDMEADWNKSKPRTVKYVDLGSFLNEGTALDKKRELAAFMGHKAHETGGGWATAPGGELAWGLYFIEEMGCNDNSTGLYVDAGNQYFPPTAGKSYHGRGPVQLSWNYNYGLVSGIIYGNKQILLDKPEMVAHDGVLAIQTALIFWMTPQPPKPSCHDIMVKAYQPSEEEKKSNRNLGFGLTINVVNGGLECGFTNSDGRIKRRTASYLMFLDKMIPATGAERDYYNRIKDLASSTKAYTEYGDNEEQLNTYDMKPF